MKEKLRAGLSKAILFSVFLLAVILYDSESLFSQPSKNVKDYKFRYVPNEAFGYSESLYYKVGYKFITAGYGSIKILPGPVVRNDRKCYDVRFEVESLKSLEFLYKIKNQFRSVLDIGGIFPWQFEERVREGKYKRDFNVQFDQVNHKAIVPKKDETYPIPDYVYDVISAFYYVRTLNLSGMKKDSVFYLNNFVKDSTHTLGVKVVGRETIEVEAGKFRCIVIEPLMVNAGLFKNEGKVSIWLTDDDRKMPVKVATKILIGYVGAELIKYSGLRGPLNSLIKDK